MQGFARLTLIAVLWIFSNAHAQEPKASPKTIGDIVAQLKAIRPDTAILAEATAFAKSEPPSSADRADLIKFYFKRSHANRTLGSVVQMLDDARKAVELSRGVGGELEGDALVELSDAELWGGNYLNARIARGQQSKLSSLGWSHSGFAMVAVISANVGDLDSAETALRASEQTLARMRSSKGWSEWGSNPQAVFERAKATVLRAKGKYGEAEVAQRDASGATDKAIEVNLRLRVFGAQEFLEARREELEAELAYLLIGQGRLQEAEGYARTTLQRTLKRVTNASPEIVSRLGPLAEVLYQQGRFNESSALNSVAIELLARSGAAPTTRAFSTLLGFEGRTLVALGKYASALDSYNRIRINLASDPALLQVYGRGDPDWALALIKTGRVDESTAMLNSLLQGWGRWQDPESVELGIAQGELGMALAARGDRTAALKQFQSAMNPLLLPRNLNAATPAAAARIGLIVESYIGLLAELHHAGERTRNGLDLAAEAFRLADAIRGRSVQSAMAAAAVRASASTPVLGELTRRDQDLTRELVALYTSINTQLALPSDQQLPAVMARARARIVAIGTERRALATTIEKDFPAYANLILPKPATVEDARQALAPGEAVVSVLVTRSGSYVWAVPKTGPVAFAASSLNGAEVSALVGSLRQSLDPGQIPLDQLAPFDLAAAYRLYAELLLPVEAGWHDAKNLLIVTNGGLAELPLALLPTQQVKSVTSGGSLYSGFRSVPWLIKRVAITQLPSVNALFTLRAVQPATLERLPFIGFGDPQFSQRVAAPVGDTRGAHLRNLAIARPLREGTESQFSTGRSLAPDVTIADWLRYDQLAPLPDTREEINAIAKALKADLQEDVFFGTNANLRAVKSLDLSKRRVIAFATHGLLPGDFPNLTQPALALAAAVDPNESGLLTLDDILGLKLNADWVVLSACNTAAGDGAGAEAISGLGRGFFYAGSRALLVTHWPVETVSAKLLVTGIFERAAADPSLSRAEALRQSMLALMEESAVDPATGRPHFSYAHPIFWAPYALVGDPGR